MSALLTLAADPSTATVLHSVGPILTASVSDTANNAILTWTGVIKSGAVLAAIIIVLVTAIKTKLAIASTLLAVVVAGFLLWAVTGDGLGWFSNGINQEFTSSPAAVEIFHGELF
jgi:uncharacterized membrane protein YdcZ (DUF606 family)